MQVGYENVSIFVPYLKDMEKRPMNTEKYYSSVKIDMFWKNSIQKLQNAVFVHLKYKSEKEIWKR